VNEGTSLIFTVTMSDSSYQNVTVTYATSNGSASSGVNYTTTGGTLTIAAGASIGEITVPTIHDNVYTTNLTMSVTLAGVTNGTLSSTVGTGTINNTDSVPSMTIADNSVNEGSNAIFTVSLANASSQNITVTYATSDGTAYNGTNYTSTSGTLTIAAGSTSGLITVPTIHDGVYTGSLTYTVTLSGATNATISGNIGHGTVVNTDAEPALSLASNSVNEGSNLIFTVTQSTLAGVNVTVTYTTSDGTAKHGTNYTTTSGTLTIAAGGSAGTITVPTTHDNLYSANLTLTLTLSGPANATLSTTTVSGTVINTDASPTLSIAAGSVGEGTSLIFTVTQSIGSSSNVTVSYTTSDGTAVSATNYTSTHGTLTIAAGSSSGTISVPTIDDYIYTSNLTMTMTLSSAGNATLSVSTGQGTIANTDTAASLAFNSPTQPTNVLYLAHSDTTYTLSNSGGSQASSVTINAPVTSPYSTVSTTCGSSIGAGSSCNYVVRFTSPGAGTLTDTVSVTYSAKGVGSSSSTVSLALSATGSALTSTIAAVYPNNGANWNDYVKYQSASSIYQQTDAACAGTETALYAYYDGTHVSCLHGGELREVPLTGTSSCTGVTASDSLGAFNWSCVVISSVAYAVSSGLKSTKNLSDLLNSTSFKNNSVSVTISGYQTYSTSSAAWWGNAVATIPTSSGASALSIGNAAHTSGDIFTVPSSMSGNGWITGAKKAAVVVMTSATLTYAGTAGGTLLGTNGNAFTWFEGTYSGNSSATIVVDDYVGNFGVLRNLDASYAVGPAILLDSVTGGAYLYGVSAHNSGAGISDSHGDNYVTATNITAKNNTGVGFDYLNYSLVKNVTLDGNLPTTAISGFNAGNNSSYSNLYIHNSGYSTRAALAVYGYGTVTINNAILADNPGVGLYVRNETGNNAFTNIRAYNNGGYGVETLGGTGQNIFANMIVSGNVSGGIYVDSTSTESNTFAFITAANNGGSGWLQDNTSLNTVSQMIASNNTTSGIRLNFGSATTIGDNFYNIVATNNGAYGIQNVKANSNAFYGNLIVGNNTTANCLVSGTTSSPGLITTTCSDAGTSGSSTYTGQSSTAVLEVSKTLASSFLGQTSSDGTNTTAGVSTTTSVAYASITDWINFDNVYRIWNIDAAFGSSVRGRCTSGNCRIWDYRLSSSDTTILNLSGNGSTVNGAFTSGAACPTAASGNTTVTDNQSHTYLLNAVEVIGDGIGNDNGLCESNEACIYAPNFGAYQGEGTLSSTCTFSAGTVTGVTMYGYPTNGD
jgi:hypothetical protein